MSSTSYQITQRQNHIHILLYNELKISVHIINISLHPTKKLGMLHGQNGNRFVHEEKSDKYEKYGGEK